MKRSEINGYLRQAVAFLEEQNFHLPQWATWSAYQWKAAGPEADEIRNRQLGWDVTDFGKGDYRRCGLLAFTTRNGVASDRPNPMLKDYCEKILLTDENQVTPTHFHWSKMEDIINRAGGNLVLELWNADPETEEIDQQREVVLSVDGIERTLQPGGKLVLQPGESVTLPPFVYHNFYAQEGSGMVLGGEVSRVNDDAGDNRFNPPLPRFPSIEEDQPPLYLLCNEYPPAKS